MWSGVKVLLVSVVVSLVSGEVDFDAVREDLRALLTNSQAQWPADYGNYGPLMIRLAWHCAGSYRSSDGRGGCDGARQRFDPERSWEDNANLDKARTLLVPIKEKYGSELSWGDLIILAGNTAIESMGGPKLGFCAGRIDDADGVDSELLGPSAEQQVLYPCPENGKCESPLGATTVGLIYVNPEGPMGVPKPEGSAPQIRDTFARMGMDDRETVALIGGGHSFGKAHGACPNGPGASPREDPSNPWPGKCGSGKGKDTFTSGFEGPWTSNPVGWDNAYFRNLLAYGWEVEMGPGGHHQWKVNSSFSSPVAAAAHGSGIQNIMMLTSDIALLRDHHYLEIVREFAGDLKAFENAFASAWYKLTTRDMGPVSRCLGNDVLPAQPWQNPLPPVDPNYPPDFHAVRKEVMSLISSTENPGAYAHLAWRCASTFRSTDFHGGCNGARIRFSPEKDWQSNRPVLAALEHLGAVKAKFGPSLSWADLIVLAGNVALESSEGIVRLPFCGGRSDATDGSGSKNLKPYVPKTASELRNAVALSSLSTRQFLAGMGAAFSWKNNLGLTSNAFFSMIAENTLTYEDEVVALSALRDDPELLEITKEFATNGSAFVQELIGAWNAIMIADRFDGPSGNECVSRS